MENIPNSVLIVFLLGQAACFGGYVFARFNIKFIALLQIVIVVFSLLMLVGHSFEFYVLKTYLLAHILAVILAHWFLVFSGISAILVEIKEKLLKSHKIGKNLPSLTDLEKNQFQLLTLALGSMVTAVIFGEWYLYTEYKLWFMWNIKIILSLVLCFGITLLLFMHHKWGTRGRKTARFILLFYFIFIIVIGISHI